MFLHPNFLLLLWLPVLLAIYQLRGPSNASVARKLFTTGLRFVALSMVIVALARPFWQIDEGDPRVVAIVDCSASMDAAAMERAAAGVKVLIKEAGRKNVRLVVFGETAREVTLTGDILTTDGLKKFHTSEPGSAIADALDLAAALCADDTNGQLHLYSDGRETRGDLVAAAGKLGRRGLKLNIHELGAPAPAPVLLCEVSAPSSAALGEAVTITATVETQDTCEVKLNVTNDKNETVVRRTVQLTAGVQEVPLLVQTSESGLQRYNLSLDGTEETLAVGIKVDRTVVSVLESAPEKPAAQALRNILGSNAEIKSLAIPEIIDGDWDGFDVLVLADTPVAELSEKLQQQLRAWVENGGGLLVTGGRNAFGPGGYARSELADMLPLRFPQKKEVRDPSTALAVIIDTSGSMGGEGVNLAKEVARLALKRLKPHDKAGIVEFHGAKRWAAPMQPASNSIAIQRALNRLSAGGGTVMLPAIEEAYYGMLNVRTRTKHVLVLTDGGVEQGAFQSLLRRMADDGIHVSTVLVGPRAGSTFLVQLANWGRGQFYTAPSRFRLPEVIVKQPSSSLLNPFVEEKVGLEATLTSQLTQGVDLENAPPLSGYVKTEPKDTTELLLQSEIGDPVLARWHYGLGRVAVLTTQLGGQWADEFFNWSTAPNMMADLVCQLRGISIRQSLALTPHWTSAGLSLDIQALSADPSLATTALKIDVQNGQGELAAEREIMPVRAYAWQTKFKDLTAGDYLIKVKDADGTTLASGGLVVPAIREFNRAGPDRDKLADAVRVANEFAATLATKEAPMDTRELWSIFAALGLVSFILMILVRRLPILAALPHTARKTESQLTPSQ